MYYKIILLTTMAFLTKEARSQDNLGDTLFEKKDTFTQIQNVNSYYSFPLVGGKHQKKSVWYRDKKQKKWINVVDTIFDSQGKYKVVINHFYFKGASFDLVNSYDRNPFTNADLRWCYFVVMDSIHIVNSFRIDNEREVNSQYLITKRNPKLRYYSKQYLSTTYDEIKSDSLELKDYGILLLFDKDTKFISEVRFEKLFFDKLTPHLKNEFKRIVFLNSGRDLKVE